MTRLHYKKNGFTLIEIIIAIVIIGLLAAVAFPSFVDSVRKSRRIDATSTLLALQLLIERRRASNIDYASSLPVAAGGTYASKNGYYSITYGPTTTAIFSVTAVPVSGTEQANDACTSFVINQNGPVLSNATDRMCWGL